MMDPVLIAMIRELVRSLSYELMLHYEDQDLVDNCGDPVHYLREAAALLTAAGVQLPREYQVVVEMLGRAKPSLHPALAGPVIK